MSLILIILIAGSFFLPLFIKYFIFTYYLNGTRYKNINNTAIFKK
jgi:hypothetical protein